MAKRIVILLVLLYLLKQHNCHVTANHLNCTSIDRNFSHFDLCELRKNENGKDEISIIIRLLQVPVTNCRLQMELMRKKPNKFAFNTSWDMCAFMSNRQKLRPLLTLYNTIGHYTNLNHTCPYNHDIIVERIQVDHLDSGLPWPAGDYSLKTSWIVDKKVRLTIKVGAVIQK